MCRYVTTIRTCCTDQGNQTVLASFHSTLLELDSAVSLSLHKVSSLRNPAVGWVGLLPAQCIPFTTQSIQPPQLCNGLGWPASCTMYPFHYTKYPASATLQWAGLACFLHNVSLSLHKVSSLRNPAVGWVGLLPAQCIPFTTQSIQPPQPRCGLGWPASCTMYPFHYTKYPASATLQWAGLACFLHNVSLSLHKVSSLRNSAMGWVGLLPAQCIPFTTQSIQPPQPRCGLGWPASCTK